MQSSSFQGWNGGYVSLYSVNGKEIQRMTITSSTPSSLEFPVPVGRGSFGWTAPNTNVNNMSVVIKNSRNTTMFSYSGASSGLEEGALFYFNNGCSTEPIQGPPTLLMADVTDGTARLTWHFNYDAPDYGYNVYRDEQLYGMVNDPTILEFFDGDLANGHCYTITGIGYNGETLHSNETCASATNCMSASNFDYEYVGENYKIKLLWDTPEIHDGLSGYLIFRTT